MPEHLRIHDKRQMQYPQCTARCEYEIKISLMQLYEANTKMDRGIKSAERADETNTEGGGEKGRLVLCRLLPLHVCHYGVEAVRCPPSKNDSTLCQPLYVYFTL